LFMADPLNHRQVFRNAPTIEEAGYQPGVGFADAVSRLEFCVCTIADFSHSIHYP
jgi:hypothetical protein